MKQLLSLALALLPCLAWAQYPSNGNQKITLGEQTTADGLFYRGLAADTTRKPSVDTMAYMLLDTATNIMWHYKKATNNAWLRLNLLPSDTASMLTNYWRSGRFAGTLPVANGGTGATSFSPNNYLIRTNASGIFDTSAIYEADGNVGIGTSSPNYKLDVNGTGRYSGNLIIYKSSGNVINTMQTGGANVAIQIFKNSVKEYELGCASSGIFSLYDATSASNRLIIASTGEATFSSSVTATTGIFTNYAGGGTTGASIDNTGQIVRTSSIELKNNISNIKYGLNDILKITPISFNWKDENKFGSENENGFIAEDVYTIIPNVVSSDNNGIFMDYTKLIPILTKAIQEQNVLIKALEQRIINLENK